MIISEGEDDGEYCAGDEYVKNFIEELLITQKAEIRKMVEGKLPDIGIMASMSFSSEANHYVNGYDKAKSDFLSELDKLK